MPSDGSCDVYKFVLGGPSFCFDLFLYLLLGGLFPFLGMALVCAVCVCSEGRTRTVADGLGGWLVMMDVGGVWRNFFCMAAGRFLVGFVVVVKCCRDQQRLLLPCAFFD